MFGLYANLQFLEICFTGEILEADDGISLLDGLFQNFYDFTFFFFIFIIFVSSN
jgi:hypothetical protein